jgi:hypothetical protein
MIINQFNDKKKYILQRFDNWIMPIAQDVLDSFLKDAEQLKDKLDNKLDHLDQTTPEEWDEQAKRWAQLHSKWHDRNSLIEKILEAVVDRTRYLIDKDIQVIHDYQIQSLAHLEQESEAFKNVEKRLEHAIEDPLKQLMSLRNKPSEYTSLKQASEWIEKLQERRESYFDQLLMKIDHVMKDTVYVEDVEDWSLFLEIEGEIIFMESELHQINIDLTQISFNQESEKHFIFARLEGLLDHVQEIDEHSLPLSLQQRVQALKTGISIAIFRLV